MFYNTPGQPLFPMKVAKEYIFDPSQVTSLPSWLTTVGTSPVQTFGDMTNGGRYTIATKVATPAISDAAGLNTTAIDPTEYSEVGFFIYGLTSSNVSLTSLTVSMGWTDGTGGFYQQHNAPNSEMRFRAYPSATVYGLAQANRWQFVRDLTTTSFLNAARRKDVGFIMRSNGDIFITAGDPYEGAGVVWYFSGTLPAVDTSCNIQVVNNVAAQNSMSFDKLKLRLIK